jgi:hypothetical protein
VRTTFPVDALNTVVLVATLGTVEPSSPGIVDDVAAFSRLEFALEHPLSVAVASSPSCANGASSSGRRPGSSRWPDEPPF